MLSLPTPSEVVAEGLSDDNPILLQGVKSLDFSRLLWMFYNPSVHFLLRRPHALIVLR